MTVHSKPSDHHTVAGLAAIEEVTPETIRRWIREGRLVARREAGRLLIPIEDNLTFLIERIRLRHDRELEPWVPASLERYAEWHTVLDELVWLLKVTHSAREELQRRRFRLDHLFCGYLQGAGPDLRRIARAFGGGAGAEPREVQSDLKRGWYNELAYAFPIRQSTLGLTFRDVEANKRTSEVRMLFPSWRFIQAYYTVYYYVRAVTRQKYAGFRLEQHGATLNTFKSSVAPALEGILWNWPFSIAYVPRQRIRRSGLPISAIPHLRWQYARHPRTPNRTPIQSFEFVQREFRKRGRSGIRPRAFNLVDYLYEFRVWANYQDIENILSLWGPGYRAIIDMNLSVVLFFLGGVAEIAVIAHQGEPEYLQLLQEFYDGYASQRSEVAAQFAATPVFQRYEIYRALGIVTGTLALQAEPRPHAIDASWVAVNAMAGSG